MKEDYEIEDRIYTPQELRNLEIVTDEYRVYCTEGTIRGTLVMKAWAHKGALRVFFDTETEGCILAVVQYFHKYRGFCDIPVGSQLELTFEKSGNGIYLTNAIVLDSFADELEQ